jgi:hypothetical protein
MQATLINLAYQANLAGFDDRPLRAVLEGRCVAEVNEYFFVVDGVPHLTCFVKWRDGYADSSCGEDGAPRADLAPRKAAPRRVEPAPRTKVARHREVAAPAARPDPRAELSAAEGELFERLRAWRRTKSEAAGVPAFRVLSNRQLAAIARSRPRDPDALARVPGIGALRAENYGAEVLAMVASSRREAGTGLAAASAS